MSSEVEKPTQVAGAGAERRVGPSFAWPRGACSHQDIGTQASRGVISNFLSRQEMQGARGGARAWVREQAGDTFRGRHIAHVRPSEHRFCSRQALPHPPAGCVLSVLAPRLDGSCCTAEATAALACWGELSRDLTGRLVRGGDSGGTRCCLSEVGWGWSVGNKTSTSTYLRARAVAGAYLRSCQFTEHLSVSLSPLCWQEPKCSRGDRCTQGQTWVASAAV